jgi:hypothetical protein
MLGTGRPGDPLWAAIGFALGVAPEIYLRQFRLGRSVGLVLAIACGLIREDIRRG